MIVANNQNKNFLFITTAVLIVTSFLFMPIVADELWWREVFNSGHTIFFLLLSFVLCFKLHAAYPSLSARIIYLSVLVLMLLLGIAIELIQSQLQREASINDLYRNFVGIISGIGFVMVTRQKSARNKVLTLVVSLVFLFLGAFSLFQIGLHYVQRSNAFPMIADFDKKWSSSFVRFNNTKLLGHASFERDKAMEFYRLRFDAAKYPGVSVIEPEKNWLGYGQLHLNVYSGNESDIGMTIRVHDRLHTQAYSDRFNKSYVIRRGLNKIVVNLSEVRKAPIDREMDLTNIAGVEFFLINLEASIFLEVSNIYLEF